MLITDHFVHVHVSKTGGTFVESMVRKLYEARGCHVVEVIEDQPLPWRQRIQRVFSRQPAIFLLQHYPIYISDQPAHGRTIKHAKHQTPNKHGWVYQIPPEHRHKPILTTIRNPYDRIVSQFEYKNWQQARGSKYRESVIASHYPHFPNLTFAEYVELMRLLADELMLPKLSPEDQIGYQTREVLRTLFQDPLRLLDIDADYLAERRYREDVAPNLHYTFTHDLNHGLYQFLRKLDFPHEEIAFILEHNKVLPRKGGRREDQAWEKYYTPELKALVRRRERVMFEMFPEFGQEALDENA